MKEATKKAIEIISFEAKMWKLRVRETLTKKRQFEANVRAEFTLGVLNAFLENTDKHEAMIGKEVYRFERSFAYTELDDYLNDKSINKFLNPLAETSTHLSEQRFEEFVEALIRFHLNYQTDALLNNQLVLSSADKLTNLISEWESECRQELIKLFKKALNHL